MFYKAHGNAATGLVCSLPSLFFFFFFFEEHRSDFPFLFSYMRIESQFKNRSFASNKEVLKCLVSLTEICLLQCCELSFDRHLYSNVFQL